jgi:transcriptional regulator with XRE-family HTH domain
MRWSSQESKSVDERAARFGEWLTWKLGGLGYDLGPRGGGRARFAEETGVSAATVGRAVSGKKIPEPKLLKLMAPALQVSFGDLLVQAGVTTEQEVQEAARIQPPPGRHVTPEEAAALLGLTDTNVRQLFVVYTRELQRQQRERDGSVETRHD